MYTPDHLRTGITPSSKKYQDVKNTYFKNKKKQIVDNAGLFAYIFWH